MSDGGQTPLSSFFLFPPLRLREKVWEDEGEVRLLINPSAGPERASDGDLRKWRCRKAEFSQGEFQQGYMHSLTHTHTHTRARGRITLIFLARQQLGSVCIALTPAKPNLLLGFLCPHLAVLCVVWCTYCCFLGVYSPGKKCAHVNMIF